PAAPDSGWGRPAEPAQPTEPIQYGQPGQSDQWGQPARPAPDSGWGRPAEPAQPTEPIQYGQSDQWGQPAQAAAPVQPGQPNQWGQPTQPAPDSGWGRPAEPAQPTEPIQYGQPAPTAPMSTGPGAQTRPDGIGQSLGGPAGGQYLASDGRYYPLADQPGGAAAADGVPERRAPKRKMRRGLVATAVAVALVVVGGGAWALVALRGSGGAASPEEAAEALLKDIASLDLAKVASRVAPSERTLLEPLYQAATAEENQTGQSKEAQDVMADIQDALTVEFTDLAFASQRIAEGVDRTSVTAGTLSIEADTDKLAGAVLDMYDLMGDTSAVLGYDYGMDTGGALSESEIKAQIDEAFPVSKDLVELIDEYGIGELFFVTVEEDGQWFTSVSMTMAQYLYEDGGYDIAGLGDPIPEGEMRGADSPEAALENLADAVNATVQSGDLRELAKVLPVAESRLLAVYGPTMAGMFGGGSEADVIQDAAGSKTSDLSGHARVSLDRLVIDQLLDLTRSGDTWTLMIDSFSGGLTMIEVSQESGKAWTMTGSGTDSWGDPIDISARLEVPEKGKLTGEFSDGYSSVSFSYQDGCATVGAAGYEQEICGEDLGVDPAAAGLGDITGLPDLKSVLALSAVEGADGAWYISPTASLLDLAAVMANDMR
ncbi:MAG: hypothetical protein LBD77_10760, partial [Bifidobacteriaceae bacterium]|nr:hypothetical protein [Bifidobacteriaceae bacterium]